MSSFLTQFRHFYTSFAQRSNSLNMDTVYCFISSVEMILSVSVREAHRKTKLASANAYKRLCIILLVTNFYYCIGLQYGWGVVAIRI